MECATGTGTFIVVAMFVGIIIALIALIIAVQGVIRLLMGKSLQGIHIVIYILIACIILGTLT